MGSIWFYTLTIRIYSSILRFIYPFILSGRFRFPASAISCPDSLANMVRISSSSILSGQYNCFLCLIRLRLSKTVFSSIFYSAFSCLPRTTMSDSLFSLSSIAFSTSFSKSFRICRLLSMYRLFSELFRDQKNAFS